MIIILVSNQTFEVKWNHKNKKHYESKGYIFSDFGDTFIVKDPSDLINNDVFMIKAICDYCGVEFETHTSTYFHTIENYPYKFCCSKCTGKKTSEITYHKRLEKYWPKIEEFMSSKGYTLLTKKEEFNDCKTRIKYICPKHGERESSVDPIIRKGSGCRLCSDKSNGLKCKLSPDFVEAQINSINNNKLLNKEEYYKSNAHNLKILCGKCGKNTFETSYTSYMCGEGARQCSKCSRIESKNEKRISDFLSIKNITFIPEHRFPDCKDKKPLPFDFYIPLYNLCIEYDGEQHYNSHFYDTRYENPEQQFETNIRHDQIKNEYCKSHGIELLRIPYWEKDNIEQIITDKLNELDRRYSLVS